MRNEFTAIIEKDSDWFIAYCPEIPGANSQGETKEACLKRLMDSIRMILEERRRDGLKGAPADAVREVIAIL